MGVKVDIDEVKIKREITQRLTHVTQVLTAEVLKDSNYFCPHDTGALQDSAIIHSNLTSGIITWETDYAKRQYYNWKGIQGHNTNPNATSKWFESAKARFMSKWEKLANAEYHKGN